MGRAGAVILMCAMGCGDDAPRAVPDEFGCPMPRVCDILETRCQEDVFEIVTCNRDAGDLTMPPVRVIDAETYQQEALDDSAEIDEELWTRQNRAYSLFGLEPADAQLGDEIGDYTATVGAFYSPDEDWITIIHDGDALASEGAVSLLAHEFVHAQQDQEIDLATYGAATNRGQDGGLAARALIEGEAVLYDTMVSVRLEGHTARELDWESWYWDWQAAAREALVEEDFVPAMAWRYFPYAFGVEHMYVAWANGGPSGVAAYRLPPMVSARQVMAGYEADEPNNGAWVEDLGDVATPVLGPEYELVLTATLGAFIYQAFAARLGCDAPVTSLRGDSVTASIDGSSDNVIAAIRLGLTTSAERNAWRTCLGGHPDWRTRLEGGHVTVIASEDPAVLEALEPIEWGPLPSGRSLVRQRKIVEYATPGRPACAGRC